ncbi:hypothetical protein K2173_019436 [Erythroxylum novogranatense]|uniref:Uncharacterized protein n=1 Tax=Erythroxylum novogranatense TaxID=1862640 RepID=A0AAV8UET8_9ROSI|nr:hypothetical protein K2173_019436 [Erythroxylum novogranatense]
MRRESTAEQRSAEDIQKRLARPPSSTSKLSLSLIDAVFKVNPTQFNAKSEETNETKKRMKRKLEDYLDPVLISKTAAEMSSKRGIRCSDWSIDEIGTVHDNFKAFDLETCTPFEQFEQTASKRFKGEG